MNKRSRLILANLALGALLWGTGQNQAQYVPPPQLAPGVNYLLPNFANSPALTKFVDSLPGLTPAGVNNLGQYIPVAVADTTSFPGSAYYEIALVDFTEIMHSELGPTTIRGYVQVETPATLAAMAAMVPPQVSAHYPLPNGLFGVDKPHYMGPLFVATKGVPTRVKFYNLLPAGPAGDLFIPTDITVMGAGLGPDGSSYSQNRATLHLHGGDNPWISDGTAHQWITPAGQPGTLLKGASQQNVPDMPAPGPGAATFYWPNGESGRLMFFHDHAYGLTRLGVYAGETAGYLLTDPSERLLNALAPGGELPLIIQDKTFVNDGLAPLGFPVGAIAPAATAVVDPLWAANPIWGQTRGSLWFPHVYMPNQNPNDISGANPFGRWDYGAWFWPIFPSGTPPQNSLVPESFLDTPVINGTAFPYLNVNPTTYRFRVLNACNDRFINLQMYVASPIVSRVTVTAGGSGYTTPPAVAIAPAAGDTTGKGATAIATIDTVVGSPTFGQVTAIDLVTVGSGYTLTPTVVIAPPAAGTPATATATLYSAPTEVGMLPANKLAPYGWPAYWSQNDTPGMIPNVLDGRQGGVPDPATIGPSFIHIGSEGGLAAAPAVMLNTPVGFEQNKRSITVLNVFDHTLFLGPAERADVIVDFSQFAGKTLIVYNDAPAPVPAGDPRNDYYTADVDNTPQGGAPTTQAGFGPNTRTMMQIRVAAAAAAPQPISSITVTAPGAGYTAPVVTIADTPPGVGAGATASAIMSAGGVTAITMAADGYGYVAPTVTITPDPLDPNIAAIVPATAIVPAIALDPFGGINAVTVTSPGSGYTLPPIITFAGGPGVGAAAVATIALAGQITGFTVLTPGSGYSAPTVTITDPTGTGATAIANLAPTVLPAFDPTTLNAPLAAAFAATQAAPIVPAGQYARISDTSMTVGAVTYPLGSKTIQELFDPLGRMNSTLGVEVPFTTAVIQTTIPYGFTDPETEIIPDGGTQLWKITHNGVDTHAIHFHLFNVQVINRVGWDGAIKPPWPEEIGWKETVKMNPLEDIVVALKAKIPTVPFQLPNNVRTLDPTFPTNSLANFAGTVDPNNNPIVISNIVANFGHEYAWHCHLLGHEENDMMRAISLVTAPLPPTGLAFRIKSGSAILTWVDASPDETAYMVQKKTGTGLWTTLATVPAGTLTYTDKTYKSGAVYQVIAVNTVGSGVPGFPTVTAYSLPSNAAAAPLGATVITSVTQALTVGSPVVVKWTYSATDQTGFTIQRSTSSSFPTTSTVAFTVAGNVLTYTDTAVVVGLKRSTTYYYRVIATNANGTGAPSNTAPLLVHP